ncbi:TlpA family protein disulfide reductase [Candidatus Pelagibacter sp.]|nr:TlpA family protein disulfide reductase [Candidatus Pelagibacter sp.]
MKLLTLNFFISTLFLLNISFSYSEEVPKIGNVIIHQNPIKYSSVIIKNLNNKDIDILKFKNKLIILNFWATWCIPCKEEMPHLDKLQVNKKLSNLKIFPINISKESIDKQRNFFSQMDIKNLNIFIDKSGKFPQKFMLRGLPTTIFLNKNGHEFARLVGSYNFNNENFIKWLENYN